MKKIDKSINKMKNVILAFQVITLIVCCFSKASHAGQMNDLFGKRYCEIILGDKLLSLSVYNTIGLNDCPQALWNKITEKDIKEKTSAHFVRLNGPRFWVINGIDHANLISVKPEVFEGIAMRKAGILHVGIWDLLHGESTYREHAVHRHTTWIYEKGYAIYELIDPAGNVFVMQSYSIQKKPLTLQQLSRLDAELTLPKGWTFKTGILKESKTLPTIDDQAIVIQDNFLNTYQKASADFL